MLDQVRQQPVVVGVDGSPGSKAALRWALRLAGRSGADVEAVSVWKPQPASSYGVEWAAAVMATGDDLAADTERMLLDTLVEVARRYGPSVPIRPRVLRGRPADELLRAAREAQLLVLGGPAHGTVAGLLLGSVSHRCVQRATCPVLVIPAEAEAGPSRYGRQPGTVTAPWA
ncbi:universal stress protein [Nucisporomicrobium flavum]|uniref:universal stress protein n=1 Tax=Nucisporomicrobium flavum TaxID=2785915 RepID=UPI0018F46EE5|nr:universal stress protein [Nucisporomicrobium flavum]